MGIESVRGKIHGYSKSRRSSVIEYNTQARTLRYTYHEIEGRRRSRIHSAAVATGMASSFQADVLASGKSSFFKGNETAPSTYVLLLLEVAS